MKLRRVWSTQTLVQVLLLPEERFSCGSFYDDGGALRQHAFVAMSWAHRETADEVEKRPKV